MKINKNYLNLKDDYLFATISQKVSDYVKNNPDNEIIRLGIGDVTKPLCGAVISALHEAVEEMSTEEGFRGYGPYEGYEFLRNAIKVDYADKNAFSVQFRPCDGYGPNETGFLYDKFFEMIGGNCNA